MCRRVALFAACALAIPAAVLASCGAENCPLDHASRWSEASFAFEVSYQYIDQNQPRVGAERTPAGLGSTRRREFEYRPARARPSTAWYRFRFISA